jgi:ferredoxin-NADP reductase
VNNDSPETESGIVPLRWQEATVREIVTATPRVKLFTLAPMAPFPFVAGQHVDLRLTAPDGYQAQRSYSIASAPDAKETFELGIELMPDGEVSPFFHDVVARGDTIEFRGPIGGHFNWQEGDGGPILLVGGGSGVVPLVSILRHRFNTKSSVPMVLIYSVRTVADIIFREELERLAISSTNFWLYLAITRETSADPKHHSGRIDDPLVSRALRNFGGMPLRIYVCGANRFVETAASLLIGMGIESSRVRTERYGGAG